MKSKQSSIVFRNIDSLKFIFALVIAYMHFTYYAFVKNLYPIQRYNNSSVYLIVEFFFIIAGFFLFQTFKNKEQTWCDFTKRKIIRLWPVLAFSIIISIILYYLKLYPANSGLDVQFLNMLFLESIGVAPKYYGYNWYISAYFWVTIFYFYILKVFKNEHANLIIALCIYFSLVGNLNHSNFRLNEIFTTYGFFFNAALLRALTGIGLGYFTGIFYDKIKNYINSRNFDNTKTFIISSMAEFACCLFLIKYMLLKHNTKNALIFIIVFLILFLLFLFKKGIISKLLDGGLLASFGKYAYSIYVMQSISFHLTRSLMWKVPFLIIHSNIALFIALIVATILGILAYHFVEKPVSNYLKKVLP